MGRMKDLRLFIAEDIVNRSEVLDLEVGFIIADVLWDDAMVWKEQAAIEELKEFIKRWEKERGA